MGHLGAPWTICLRIDLHSYIMPVSNVSKFGNKHKEIDS